MERAGLSHLFEDQLVGPASPVYWLFGALFLALLVGSSYVYLLADRRLAPDRFSRQIARRFAKLLGGFSALGLAANVFALLAVPFLSKRVWLVLAVAGLLASGGYAAFYFRRRYPAERSAYLDQERRLRYLPRARGTGRRRRARQR